MPAHPKPVPKATVHPDGRGFLLTVDGATGRETRLVTASQVAHTQALFGLPEEGLRIKLFDIGEPVDTPLEDDKEHDATWLTSACDDAPEPLRRKARHGPRLRY